MFNNFTTMNELLEHLSAGDVVFFAGAALSMRPPSYLPLAFQLVDNTVRAVCGQELSRFYPEILPSIRGQRRIALLAPELIFQTVYNVVGEYGLDILSILDTRPASNRANHNHRILAKAAGNYFNMIITTNFDLLIEEALEHERRAYKVYASEDSFPSPNQLESLSHISIIKLHGSIDDKSSIVATVNQAGTYLPNKKAQVLEYILQNFYVCFVGYSGADMDIFPVLQRTACKGIFWLLKPPGVNTDLKLFRQTHAEIFNLLETKSGKPIVDDIDHFFDIVGQQILNLPPDRRNFPPAPDYWPCFREWASKMHLSDRYFIISGWSEALGKGVLSADVASKVLPIVTLPTDVVRAMDLQARGYERSGNYNQQIVTARKIWVFSRKHGYKYGQALALWELGNALRIKSGNLSLTGILKLIQAYRIFHLLPGRGARIGEGQSLCSLGYIYRRLCPTGQLFRPFLQKAAKIFEESSTLFRNAGEVTLYANALRGLAEVYGKLGQYKRALQAIEYPEFVSGRIGDQIGLSNAKRTHARILLWSGQPHEALECYKQAFQASSIAHDVPGIAKSLLGQADVLRMLGDYSNALDYYQKASSALKQMSPGIFRTLELAKIRIMISVCRALLWFRQLGV